MPPKEAIEAALDQARACDRAAVALAGLVLHMDLYDNPAPALSFSLIGPDTQDEDDQVTMLARLMGDTVGASTVVVEVTPIAARYRVATAPDKFDVTPY
jgi:hypothetical protein